MPAKKNNKAAAPKTQKPFYFGAQYFRPPTPPREDWERDFKSMKKCGMNIMRMWCLWSWHEPKKGEYDWEDIHGLLKLCKKYDIKAILLIDLESTPAWLNKMYPEAVYLGHDGTTQPPDGVANHPSGMFPGLNMDYPEIQQHAEEWLRAIVKEFKGREEIWGWEPHNEPIIEPARMKFADEQVFSYNRPSIEHFRKWLKKKYKTIDKLNQVWSRKYGAWDEIEPPRRIPGGTAQDFLDWTLHNTHALTERVAWRCEVMRDEDPDIHLKLHTRAYGGMQGNAATWGMDDWALAQLPDTWGGSSFYRQWPDAGYFLNNDNLWSTAKGKDFWLSEVQGGPPGGGMGRPGTYDDALYDYTPQHMKMWTMMALAHAAKGFMYWQFRMERKGPEYGFGVTAIDGSWTQRCDIAKEMGDFIAKYEQFLVGAEPETYQVAVGYSMPTNMLEMIHRNAVWFPTESIMGAYKLTLHLDFPTYILRLDEEAVDDDYSPYKLITIPYGTWLSPKTVQKLKKWVKAGGTLIADAGCGEFTNDQCWWSETVPGYGLDEVFGVRRFDVRTMNKAGDKFTDTEHPCHHTVLGTDFNTCNFMEKLEVTADSKAEIIGEWPDGTPAVTINRYGKGRAVYIGSSAFYAYSNNEERALKDLYEEITAEYAQLGWTDSNDTHVRVIRNGAKRMYFVFNYNTSRTSAWVTLSDVKKTLRNAFTDEPVSLVKTEEGKSFRLEMVPFDVQVFIEG